MLKKTIKDIIINCLKKLLFKCLTLKQKLLQTGNAATINFRFLYQLLYQTKFNNNV